VTWQSVWDKQKYDGFRFADGMVINAARLNMILERLEVIEARLNIDPDLRYTQARPLDETENGP